MTTPQRPPAPVAKKKKRGSETAGDMIRSMGLVMLIVVPLWFLAQPPKSDEQAIRVVDPTADVRAFRAAAPGLPLPAATPQGWRPTSSTLDPGSLRIGYVLPANGYAEYAASTAPAAGFLPGITGDAEQVATFDVEGVPWQQYRDAGGHDSLVRTVGGGTVVVGGVREIATLDQLRTLALAVR